VRIDSAKSYSFLGCPQFLHVNAEIVRPLGHECLLFNSSEFHLSEITLNFNPMYVLIFFIYSVVKKTENILKCDLCQKIILAESN
jgi:hypothetical protein